jgi:hypothetical protein
MANQYLFSVPILFTNCLPNKVHTAQPLFRNAAKFNCFWGTVTVKVKLSLCLINWEQCHKEIWRSGGIALPFLTYVGIGTRLQAERPRFDSRQGQDIFSTPQGSNWLWGLLSLLSSEFRGLLLLGKRTGSEIDRSPPSTFEEVKNDGAIPPPPYFFMAWCVIN